MSADLPPRRSNSGSLTAMKVDADRTRAAMIHHSPHGQMAAWAALGERLTIALDAVDADACREVMELRGEKDRLLAALHGILDHSADSMGRLKGCTAARQLLAEMTR